MELCYPTSSLHTGEELFVAVVGPFMLHVAILPLLLIRWVCQLLFASCPDVLSKLIITMGLWAVLDPLAMFIVDVVLRWLTHKWEISVADAAKLYWLFERTKQSGILGVKLTVLLYTLLFIISSLILHLYCLRYIYFHEVEIFLVLETQKYWLREYDYKRNEGDIKKRQTFSGQKEQKLAETGL